MGAPGCDDAPFIDIVLNAEPQRPVTLIYPYYENPIFLGKQLEHWTNNWPQRLAKFVSLILVDDGSPEFPAEHVLSLFRLKFPFPIRLFRVDVDVRWNWLAARNIGAHHACERPPPIMWYTRPRPQDGWISLTDMDHVIPEQTLETLIHGEFDPNIIYRFSRIGVKTHPHPNSWFMTRAMYWKIGGYDEALSGHYGTDGLYRRRCAVTAPIRIMTAPLVLHEHEYDASTTRYLRKQPEDAAGKQIARARAGQPPKVLTFPYHEVTL
jgi:hypothetical protein